MGDTIYKVLLTIINKEQNGYISPEEFNLLANNVQQEIFRSYFEDENLDKNKQNRGLTNRGYSNLPFNQRQRITPFAATTDLTVTSGSTTLPADIYFVEDNGLTTSAGIIIDEVERSSIARMVRTEVAPTELYPVYESYGGTLKIYPTTISDINVRYIRKPKPFKWTYTIVSGKEMYNPTNPSFQDFELHQSEFSNIILRMLTFFGINLREEAVIRVAEALKARLDNKDNS